MPTPHVGEPPRRVRYRFRRVRKAVDKPQSTGRLPLRATVTTTAWVLVAEEAVRHITGEPPRRVVRRVSREVVRRVVVRPAAIRLPRLLREAAADRFLVGPAVEVVADVDKQYVNLQV